MARLKKTFYITTAIDYPNSQPHIGHAFEKVVADTMARWKRLTGYDTFFLTGTDEHGQKLATAAQAKGLEPQQFVDEMARVFIQFAKRLDISFDDFIRTSDKRHKEVATEIFSKVYKKGDIYKGYYEGHYCMPCERFYTEKDLVVGHCPECKREVKWLKEEAYFFAMSKYKQQIIEHIEKNKSFIVPEFRRNEILSRLKNEELRDLCVSRSGITWGIPLPTDKKHVIYVWFDALVNYISALDYPAEKFVRYWPAHHVIGKDILWFHSVIWPAILLAAGIQLPRQIYVHGFINDASGEKMSKSKGNVVDPFAMMDTYGPDVLRYYLLRSIPVGQDGNFSEKDLIIRNNTELANDLGNLILRVQTLIAKNWNNEVPKAKPVELFDVERLIKEMDAAMNEYEFNIAIEKLWEAIHLTNKYLNETEPWKKQKEEQAVILYTTLDALRIISILSSSFIPETTIKLRNILGLDEKCDVKDCKWGKLKAKTKLGQHEILFVKKEFAEKKVFPLCLKAGRIKEIAPHPDADKLYMLKVDIGKEIQLVAGIKQFFTLEQLKDKIIIIVSNLKHAVIRNVQSQGMLLAADDGKNVTLLTCDANPGEEVEISGYANATAEIAYEEFAKVKLSIKDTHVFYDNNELSIKGKPVIAKGIDEKKAKIR